MKEQKSPILSIILIIVILTAAVLCLYFYGKSTARHTMEEAPSAALERTMATPSPAAAPKAVRSVTPRPTASPTPEPTPSPTPEPIDYLGDLENVTAATPVEEERIDRSDINRYFRSYEISDTVFERIYGDNRSYKTYSTIPREDLRYVKVLYRGFDGITYVGEVMVNVLLADEITEIFRELYLNDYPIERMVLVDEYDADDNLSIANNNTSAFNYRPITGGTSPSNHAFGCAIDINPKNNPYIEYDAYGNPYWYDAEAESYLDRDAPDAYERHMITHEDLCYRLFTERGWSWGGDWSNPVDYQHFEKPIYP